MAAPTETWMDLPVMEDDYRDFSETIPRNKNELAYTKLLVARTHYTALTTVA